MTQHRAALRTMFADLERMDVHAWASHLAPDAVMRVGNDAPVCGRERCREALAAFCARLAGLRHDVVELWEHGEATIVEATITCRLADDREVTLPVVKIYRTVADGLIADYRVYVDVAPVRAAASRPEWGGGGAAGVSDTAAPSPVAEA